MTACAKGVSEGTRLTCPPLRTYTKADQLKVAQERELAAPGAVWPAWITDYGRLRAACRAIADKP